MEFNNACIICYTFPPAPGIGGRRWSKFAKYLTREGISVKVITNRYKGKAQSNWNSDVELYKEHIIQINAHSPYYIVNQSPHNIFGKLNYKYSLYTTKFKNKGYYYDPTINWFKYMLPTLEILYNNGFRNFIVSGGPFHICYDFIAFKKKHNDINLIIDFRDPWLNNKTSYSYKNLSEKRYNQEHNKEIEVANNADYIIGVSHEIVNYFKKLCKNPHTQFITLPNGFDLDDYKDMSQEKKSSDENLINFSFTGTLYEAASDAFNNFINALLKLKSIHPLIYNSFRFSFYGHIPKEFVDLVKKNNICVIQFQKSVQLQEVYEIINNSDVCMLFLSNDLNYSFSTKFYEYLSQKKPIAVFSNGGYTGTFVSQNQLGFNFDFNSANYVDIFLSIYKSKHEKKLKITSPFIIDNYNMEHITNTLMGLLK